MQISKYVDLFQNFPSFGILWVDAGELARSHFGARWTDAARSSTEPRFACDPSEVSELSQSNAGCRDSESVLEFSTMRFLGPKSA